MQWAYRSVLISALTQYRHQTVHLHDMGVSKKLHLTENDYLLERKYEMLSTFLHNKNKHKMYHISKIEINIII